MDAPAPLTLSAAGVAGLIGRSVSWFYSNRRRLEREHGFPPPVPGLAGLWDPEAVRAWVRGAATPVQAPAPAPLSPDDVAGWRAELDRRALALSQPAGTA